MGIKVYDTYVDGSDGQMHFDVFVPEDKDDAFAVASAKTYLESVGEGSAKITSDECSYCHIQNPTEEQSKEIAEKGYFIYKMSNCK